MIQYGLTLVLFVAMTISAPVKAGETDPQPEVPQAGTPSGNPPPLITPDVAGGSSCAARIETVGALPSTLGPASIVARQAEFKAERDAKVAETAAEQFQDLLAILDKHDVSRGQLEVMDKVTAMIATKRPVFESNESSGLTMSQMNNAGQLGKDIANATYKVRARTQFIIKHQSRGVIMNFFTYIPFLHHLFTNSSIFWQAVKDGSSTVDDVLNDMENTARTELASMNEIKTRHDKRMTELSKREHAAEDYSLAMEAQAKKIRDEVKSKFPDGSKESKLFEIIARTYDQEAQRWLQVAQRYAENGQKGEALTLFVLEFRQILDTETLLAKASISGGAMSAEASGQLQVLKELSYAYRQAANESDAAFSADLLRSANDLKALTADHSADALRKKAEADFAKSLDIIGEVEAEQVASLERRRAEAKAKIEEIRNSDVTLRVRVQDRLEQGGALDTAPMIQVTPRLTSAEPASVQVP